MIYMTLDKNMVEILKSIKGCKFVSYECARIFSSTYGNLRINTDKTPVEITNLQKVMPFFDIEEEIAGFSCKIVDPNIEFKPYCIEPFSKYDVGEKIKELEIVNDTICINDGEYEISFDQAIIIRTDKSVIMFSRDIWFSEDIKISEHDNYDDIFPISQAVDSWSDEGDNKVIIKRTTKKL